VVSEQSNVQDNSWVIARDRTVHIGSHSTIGHNVSLVDCQIGCGVLVGMGSVVASNTEIQDDVLLAAGSHTEEGQVLRSGYLWAGRPARALKPLNSEMRAIIASVNPIYQIYSRQFKEQKKVREASSLVSKILSHTSRAAGS
jgi:carbonic anhydrase/acetyltransferase-like protein (isoleucine patch superfamily)